MGNELGLLAVCHLEAFNKNNKMKVDLTSVSSLGFLTHFVFPNILANNSVLSVQSERKVILYHIYPYSHNSTSAINTI